jgi:CRP-like cAMP-binding protein
MMTKELHPDDELLVIASDGIWEFITNQDALQIIDRYKDPLEGCKHVVAEAYKLWMIHDIRTDDITVITIQLNWAENDTHAGGLASHVQGGVPLSPRALQMQHAQVRPVRRGMSKAKRQHLNRLHAAGGGDDGQTPDPPFMLTDHTAAGMTADEADMIHRAVRGNYLFGHLNSNQRASAVSCMEKVKVSVGQVLINQGDGADYYYVACSGEFDVYVQASGDGDGDGGGSGGSGRGELVHTYTCVQDDGNAGGDGGGGNSNSGHRPSFGELGLLHRHKRAATVVCRTGGEVWRMSQHAFRALLLRTEHKELVGVLRRVNILHSLHGNQICSLADLLTEVSYEAGQEIIHEGSVCSDFFIIKTGRVRVDEGEGKGVEKGEGQGKQQVMSLGRYDYFNEQSLAVGSAATNDHTYTASEPTVCLHIERSVLEHHLGHLSDLISDHAAKRMITHHIRSNISTVGGDDVSSLSNIQRMIEIAKLDYGNTQDGAFGMISLSRHTNHPEHLFTIRTVSKRAVTAASQTTEVIQEKEIIKSMDHLPSVFFPDVIATFADDTTLYTLYATLVTFEFASLLAPGKEGTGSSLSEDEARFYTAALVAALQVQ